MAGPTVIICIDGFDPDYLDASPMPNLRAMGRGGFLVTGRSMMPSVTNVNNVSIVTARYPSEHGICSNYRWDRQTGEELYVESAEYIRSQSMFSRAEELGMTSLVRHVEGQAPHPRGSGRHHVSILRAAARLGGGRRRDPRRRSTRWR